jgi:phospho-N-acetylmuramoyl-pentapeptide-transferase
LRVDKFFQTPIWQAFWFPFLVALIVSFPLMKWLRANAKQIIDPHAPEGHQVKKGTPTMGGIMIVAGVLATFLLQQFSPVAGGGTPPIWPFVTFFAFAFIGFVDDYVVPKMIGKRGLGWLPKLAMQFAAAGLPAWFAHREIGLTLIFAFFILFLSNAFNFADGLDSLAGSLWIALMVGMMIMGMDSRIHSAILAGVLVFLFYNAPPARVFMGDVASLPIGAALGWAVAQRLASSDAGAFLGIEWSQFPIMLLLCGVMIAELVPVPMQVAYYKLTKKRLFPMTPIHHAFEKKGWKETRVVWTFFLAQLLLSIAAVTIYANTARVNIRP